MKNIWVTVELYSDWWGHNALISKYNHTQETNTISKLMPVKCFIGSSPLSKQAKKLIYSRIDKECYGILLVETTTKAFAFSQKKSGPDFLIMPPDFQAMAVMFQWLKDKVLESHEYTVIHNVTLRWTSEHPEKSYLTCHVGHKCWRFPLHYFLKNKIDTIFAILRTGNATSQEVNGLGTV